MFRSDWGVIRDRQAVWTESKPIPFESTTLRRGRPRQTPRTAWQLHAAAQRRARVKERATSSRSAPARHLSLPLCFSQQQRKPPPTVPNPRRRRGARMSSLAARISTPPFPMLPTSHKNRASNSARTSHSSCSLHPVPIQPQHPLQRPPFAIVDVTTADRRAPQPPRL